jgi:hypothetical protein
MENQEKKQKTIYSKTSSERFVDKLIRGKGSFMVRNGSECNELLFDNSHYIFPSKNRIFPSDMIFLFNMVRLDVKKYLSLNDDVIPPIKVNVTEYNYNYQDKNDLITATDLNHAFWRIAFVKGYIRKETYDKGLASKAKAIRLATLSVLGREKKFDTYVDGIKTESFIFKELNEKFRNVYIDIRYSCYYMMYEVSQLLGDDFDCWKTDCIYYRDTPQNRKLVHNYFDKKNMTYKQLVFKQ